METNEQAIANSLLNWIKELHVEENDMRTDAVVDIVVSGITEGNCQGLDAILEGDPKSIVSESVMRRLSDLLAQRLYPDGAYTVEDVSYEVSDGTVTAEITLHLAYP